MKIITTKVYEFDELNEKAKEKARGWYRDGSLEYEWSDGIYEDAKNIGLRVDEFDINRNSITGKLLKSVGEVCADILDNHGKSCGTYHLAKEYYRRKHTKSPFTEEEFLHDILEEYLVILRGELEYLYSDESVDETIRANEYTFTETGKREG